MDSDENDELLPYGGNFDFSEIDNPKSCDYEVDTTSGMAKNIKSDN